MRSSIKFFGYILFIFLIMAHASFASERETNFDKGWKFYRGSVANAELAEYNDSKWRSVDLPHDWSMDPTPVQKEKEGVTIGPFSKYNEGGAGGADIAQTLGGEGWYRKQFTISREDEGKKIMLYIEGAYNQSELFLNGKKINFNPYGYMSYKVDLTTHCNPAGRPNTIAIRILNAGQNSRWYAGSGLYRHVKLIKTDKVRLDAWDTFVRLSELKIREAIVKVSTIVHNDDVKDHTAGVTIQIYSPAGKVVARGVRQVNVSQSGKASVDFLLDIPKVELWSLETPVLYTAKVSVSNGNKSDEITIPIGIRSIEFNTEKGFLLNGKSVKLKGACIHHDNGLLGAAAINRAEERKVELLKANGYNAIRAAHNPPSEYFLDVCDRLGMLVIDESFDQWQKPKRANDYHQYFDEWSEHDLKNIVRRDRNHPSIIMWSIGNEIADRLSDAGVEIARRLRNYVYELDDTRAVTAGVNSHWDNRGLEWDSASERAFRHLDVAGYNYKWDKYESDHTAFPNRVIYGSESVPKEAHVNWNFVEKHPYVIGDFVWTGIDYLGEAGLGQSNEMIPGEGGHQFMPWPWYNAWCGDIDFTGDKKPQSYYRDILWRQREITMAVQAPITEGKKEVVNFWGWRNELPIWTWNGREGETMTVRVYSRNPQVRLYQDGKLIGQKETGKDDYTATFEVVYRPGVLKAVNIQGKKERASVVLKTAGKPAAIRLTADRQKIKADKNDLSYVKIDLVDNEGHVVPNDVPVTIKFEGEGSVIAAGNAAPDDMKSFRSLSPRTFRGKAIAIVQPNGQKAGEIKVTVSADGFEDSQIIIKTVPH